MSSLRGRGVRVGKLTMPRPRKSDPSMSPLSAPPNLEANFGSLSKSIPDANEFITEEDTVFEIRQCETPPADSTIDEPLKRVKSGRTVRPAKLIMPRPRNSSSEQTTPQTATPPIIDTATLMNQVDAVMVQFQTGDVNVECVENMCEAIRLKGADINESLMCAAFNVFRKEAASGYHNSIVRLHLLRVLELRARGWMDDPLSDKYYSDKLLQLKNVVITPPIGRQNSEPLMNGDTGDDDKDTIVHVSRKASKIYGGCLQYEINVLKSHKQTVRDERISIEKATDCRLIIVAEMDPMDDYLHVKIVGPSEANIRNALEKLEQKVGIQKQISQIISNSPIRASKLNASPYSPNAAMKGRMFVTLQKNGRGLHRSVSVPTDTFSPRQLNFSRQNSEKDKLIGKNYNDLEGSDKHAPARKPTKFGTYVIPHHDVRYQHDDRTPDITSSENAATSSTYRRPNVKPLPKKSTNRSRGVNYADLDMWEIDADDKSTDNEAFSGSSVFQFNRKATGFDNKSDCDKNTENVSDKQDTTSQRRRVSFDDQNNNVSHGDSQKEINDPQKQLYTWKASSDWENATQSNRTSPKVNNHQPSQINGNPIEGDGFHTGVPLNRVRQTQEEVWSEDEVIVEPPKVVTPTKQVDYHNMTPTKPTHNHVNRSNESHTQQKQVNGSPVKPGSPPEMNNNDKKLLSQPVSITVDVGGVKMAIQCENAKMVEEILEYVKHKNKLDEQNEEKEKEEKSSQSPVRNEFGRKTSTPYQERIEEDQWVRKYTHRDRFGFVQPRHIIRDPISPWMPLEEISQIQEGVPHGPGTAHNRRLMFAITSARYVDKKESEKEFAVSSWSSWTADEAVTTSRIEYDPYTLIDLAKQKWGYLYDKRPVEWQHIEKNVPEIWLERGHFDPNTFRWQMYRSNSYIRGASNPDQYS